MSDDYEYPYRYTRTVLAGVEVKRADSAKENQLTVRVDADGYVVGGSSTRAPGDFLIAMRATRDRYPLEHADIVLPDDTWTLNEDGSATKIVEHDGEVKAVLTTQHIELSTPAVRPSRPSAASTEREST